MNQTDASQPPGLPTNGHVAATGLGGQAVNEDDGPSQSRSMSNSSSSSSPVKIQVANVPSEADTPTAYLAAENGSENTESAEQAPTASAVASSDVSHSATTENVPPQDNVSIENLLDAVPHGVSHIVSESSALLPESGREGQTASVADVASVPPVTKSSETKHTSTDMNKAISVSTLPKARLPHDKIGILEDRTRDDPRGDLDAWLELISEYRKRNKIQEARDTYERFFLVFPAAVRSRPLTQVLWQC